MQQRHQQGDTFPLSIEEMLDETNQLNVGPKQKMWLINEVSMYKGQPMTVSLSMFHGGVTGEWFRSKIVHGKNNLTEIFVCVMVMLILNRKSWV